MQGEDAKPKEGDSVNLNLDAIKTIDAGKSVEQAGTVDAPKQLGYTDRIVAFVDILGFKEIIKSSAHDDELVKRIFYALDVRKDDWAEVYAQDVGLNKTADDFDDRFHSFSDCIVMSVGTGIEDIGLLVYGIFKICRQLLGQGFLSRGGIAMGKLYHHDEAGSSNDAKSRAPSMVFGPAFIEAYQFESAHADGPRVILQNQVWRMIDEHCKKNSGTKLSKFLKTHIVRADDGPAFIDLFADFGISHYYDTDRDLTEEMRTIKRHICDALDKTTDKPHYFKKNAQIAREFNKAIHRSELTEFLIPKDKLPQRHN